MSPGPVLAIRSSLADVPMAELFDETAGDAALAVMVGSTAMLYMYGLLGIIMLNQAPCIHVSIMAAEHPQKRVAPAAHACLVPFPHACLVPAKGITLTSPPKVYSSLF